MNGNTPDGRIRRYGFEVVANVGYNRRKSTEISALFSGFGRVSPAL